MNKTLLYLFILIAIGALAFFMMTQQSSNTLKGEDTDFGVADTAAVNKVTITDREGRTVELTRQSEAVWKLNTGYKARPDAVSFLLRTLKKLQVVSPVSNAAKENVISMFLDPVRTIKIYTDQPDTPSKEMYIGGPTTNGTGTFMLLKGSQKPYIISIPGFEGNLTTRFFTNLEEWRDRLMFNLKKSEIARVKLDYPGNIANGFDLKVLAPDSFLVQPQVAVNNAALKLNKPMIYKYLNSFEDLYAEAYENGYPKTDSLRAEQPFCVLTASDIHGKARTLSFYYLPNNRRSKKQVDEQGKPIPYDPDRFLAFTNNNKDLVMIQHYVFGKLLKRYDDFVY